MFSKFGIDTTLLLRHGTAQLLSSVFRGALAENYGMQSLLANGINIFDWASIGKKKGELDFVF
jgi:hypothetical protein